MRAFTVVPNSSPKIASLVLTLALLALSSRLGTADPPLSPPSAVHERDVPAAPLFVENVGQFDAPARFQARVGRATLWLGDEALWVTLVDSGARGDDAKSSPTGPPTGPRGVNLKLTFVGMDPKARLVAADPQAATMNYMVGRNPAGWRTLLPTYGAIRWEGMEPGLDMVLRSAPAGVRIAFESASPVRPASMRLRVDGADALRLDGSGRLVVRIGKSTVELPLIT